MAMKAPTNPNWKYELAFMGFVFFPIIPVSISIIWNPIAIVFFIGWGIIAVGGLFGLIVHDILYEDGKGDF